MFKKILGTGAARAVNVLTQLATLIMGTRCLGAAEWGKAFIAQTDITFLLIGIEVIAGSGLVYFTLDCLRDVDLHPVVQCLTFLPQLLSHHRP